MPSYPINECYILHFDAGRDTNGNGRRCFVLAHNVVGFLAAVEESGEGTGALTGLPIRIENKGWSNRGVQRELSRRVSQRIPVSAAYRKTLLREFASDRGITITTE